MTFRLTPKIDDLELLSGKILSEFCVISRFGRQQQLNEWR